MDIYSRALVKLAQSTPSDADIRRMYDVVQADARLSNRLEGLGFGRNGEAYRRAAIKLKLMSIIGLLRDGKNIRNSIVHSPGYVASEQSTSRALKEYADADRELTERLR